MVVVIINLQRVSGLEAEDHAKILVNADRPAFWLSLERVEPESGSIHRTGMRGGVQQTQDQLQPRSVLCLDFVVASRVEILRQPLMLETLDHGEQYNQFGCVYATKLVIRAVCCRQF